MAQIMNEISHFPAVVMLTVLQTLLSQCTLMGKSIAGPQCIT